MKTRKKIRTRKNRVRKSIKGGNNRPEYSEGDADETEKLERKKSDVFIEQFILSQGEKSIKQKKIIEDEEVKQDYPEDNSNERKDIQPIDRRKSYDVPYILEETPVPAGCCILSLTERMQNIETQISNVHIAYVRLIQEIADEIYREYAATAILEPTSHELAEWFKKSKSLLYGYQRLSTVDLKKAFVFLLPQFDMKNGVYTFDEGPTTMIALVQNYAYKMVTSLFTSANITAAVIMYNNTSPWSPGQPETPPWQSSLPGPVDNYQYLKNLLSIMKCGSEIINTKLIQHWSDYDLGEYKYEDDEKVLYYHSGGNMIVMIAAMLCYLYDTKRYTVYGTDILEQIRQNFNNKLNDRKKEFYDWLDTMMENPNFRRNLYSCTENLSDLDFILMAPEKYVTKTHVTEDSLDNPLLFKIHKLSTRIIRDILNDSCNQESCARSLLPFHGKFDDTWPDFKFSDMSRYKGIDPELPKLPKVICVCKGYRQTSNRIDDVPMYLNRLKQGYMPFYSLPFNGLNPLVPLHSKMHKNYASKYGECIDLSISTLNSEFYEHKQINYTNGDYYTIDTILWELTQILLKPPDDKTIKRQIRQGFLNLINTYLVNELFKEISNIIQFNPQPQPTKRARRGGKNKSKRKSKST